MSTTVEYQNHAVEFFSYASSNRIVFFLSLVGYPPFTDEREDMNLREQIIGGHFDFPEQFWKDVSDSAKDLVRKMLSIDPAQRATMADVLAHPWFQDAEVRKKAHGLMGISEDESEAAVSSTTELTGAPLVRKRPLEIGSEAEANGSGDAKRLQVGAEGDE